ncbi:MAG: hypothetical protein ACREF9_05115, partial [Opitutaceae bacterium]
QNTMAAAVAVCALFLTTLLLPSSGSAATAAFPGAQGWGAGSTGGRGGHVYKVTSLADTNTQGTFRHAVSSAGLTGPRTIVFTVAGTITLQSDIFIRRSNLTIAGQTAPGGGIQIRGNAVNAGGIYIRADQSNINNIIVRYIRHRRGIEGPNGQGDKGFGISSGNFGATYTVSNIIVDHCSFGWQQDDNDVWDTARDITLQYNIYGEANNSDGVAEGTGGKGLLLGRGSLLGPVSVHHNFLASNGTRNPVIAGDGPVDLVNNVIYHWSAFGTQIQNTSSNGVKINVIGNFYKKGPTTSNSRYECLIDNYVVPQPNNMVWVADNLGPKRPLTSDPQWNFVGLWAPGGGNGTVPAPAALQRTSGGAWPGNANFPITVHSATSISSVTGSVLSNVGASILLNADGTFRNARDAVDNRLITEYTNGTGTPGGTNSWPTLATTPAAYADTDNDGMADTWEINKFGSITAKNGTADTDGDGHTDLEEFLNGTSPGGGGGPLTIGESPTVLLPNPDSNNANLVVVTKYNLASAATIKKLALYVNGGATGNLRLGIYDATGTGGEPGALKAQTNPIAITSTGWKIANVVTQVSLPAGDYWLAYLTDNASLGYRYTNSPAGTSRKMTRTYSSGLPATYSGGTITNSSGRWSRYAEF